MQAASLADHDDTLAVDYNESSDEEGGATEAADPPPTGELADGARLADEPPPPAPRKENGDADNDEKGDAENPPKAADDPPPAGAAERQADLLCAVCGSSSSRDHGRVPSSVRFRASAAARFAVLRVAQWRHWLKPKEAIRERRP